jgi:hypothetical protein
MAGHYLIWSYEKGYSLCATQGIPRNDKMEFPEDASPAPCGQRDAVDPVSEGRNAP